jgi:ornithine cyclodeaminase/alanine dehydrogenase-like protein (mu-crystallin family)
VRVVDAAALARLLPMPDAIEALRTAFAARALPTAPARTATDVHGGQLLTMPAWDDAGAGVKLVSVQPANAGRAVPVVQGAYVLFAAETLTPEAVIDGAALTALRTAAVSGLATRLLANAGAHRLVLFGAGAQAHAHLDAMRAVRPVTQVTVVSRGTTRAHALVERARAVGLSARVGDPDAVSAADLVCTCTTSAEPVFNGTRLAAGAHVNAVGAYQPHTRELDDETVRRGRVVVEDRDAVLTEAGDLLLAARTGAVPVAADLSEVVRGLRVRTARTDVTVFKSVGVAFEDLVVARAAAARL